VTPRKLVKEADAAIAEAQRLVDVALVARYFKVSSESVRRWIRSGRVRGERTPTGRYKVLASDFEEIKAHARNVLHVRQRFT